LAAWADLPRIRPASRFTLRGVVWIVRTEAFASVSLSRRAYAFFPIALYLCLDRLLVGGGMAMKVPGRRELAELVTDHVLRHEHGQELVAVVDPEGEADELRQDRRATRPGLDNLVATRRPRRFRLFQQVTVDEGAFPNRASQGLSPPLTFRRDGGAGSCR